MLNDQAKQEFLKKGFIKTCSNRFVVKVKKDLLKATKKKFLINKEIYITLKMEKSVVLII